MKFHGKAENGEIKYYRPAERSSWITSLEGREVTETIEKTKIRKTNAQNNGLHLLVDFFRKELNDLTGNDLSMDEIKDIIKFKRNLTEDITDKNTGEIIGQKLRSFADLGLQETSETIEWIYSYAATGFNITLPELKQLTDMPLQYDKNGAIIGVGAAKTTEAPGKVLSKEEFKDTYGNVNGVDASQPLKLEQEDPNPPVPDKKKRQTKKESVAAKVAAEELKANLESKPNPAKEEAEKKLLATRLNQLHGVEWDGKNATFNGKIVASKQSILSLSDISFAAIAEAQRKVAWAEEGEKKDSAEVVNLRYDRLNKMGLIFVEKDEHFHFNNQPVIHWMNIADFTDAAFEQWVIEFQKSDSEKVANDRINKLMDLGLSSDGITLFFQGNGMIALGTVKGLRTDADFEEVYKSIDEHIKSETKVAVPEITDAEKIEQLLEKFYGIVASLPVVESDDAKVMVAGTRTLVGKITGWLETEKAKL